jgi:hypothetical protein
MSSKSSSTCIAAKIAIAALLCPLSVVAQQTALRAPVDDPDARPPITQADLKIVQRASRLLASPSKWNRADNRRCPDGAKTLSLYCALETATTEVGREFQHRGAALQEVRFVIDEIAADRNYDHRLMDYNNDPKTSFADVQDVLRITETLIRLRLKGGGPRTAPSPNQ